MLSIDIADIRRRLALDNPWWTSGGVPRRYREWPRRDYFAPFFELVESTAHRSVVLMGPRRVGKTVMLHQAIDMLLTRGVDPDHILHVPLDAPLYDGLGLERFVLELAERGGLGREDRFYAFFDEIQYLRDWEVHLKSLHDTWPEARFMVSGSAAAALRRQSRESGAGRFTDFLLPPLTFREFLRLGDREAACGLPVDEATRAERVVDIEALNAALVDYVNHGGFPEAVLDEAVRRDPDRYIRQDIIDKVLLRDLPGLYGINDVQELNRFFAHLAYNTGQEVSFDELSKRSHVSKNTLRKYLEYLEAAFLVRTLDRVDRDAKRFARRSHFKVYLTNPSLRAALFGRVGADDPAMGALVETAVLAQWAHDPDRGRHLSYARWKGGEVDLISTQNGVVRWATEVKWSDRFAHQPTDLKGLRAFSERNSADLMATSKTTWARTEPPPIVHAPAAWVIYELGRNLVRNFAEELMTPAASPGRSRPAGPDR